MLSPWKPRLAIAFVRPSPPSSRRLQQDVSARFGARTISVSIPCRMDGSCSGWGCPASITPAGGAIQVTGPSGHSKSGSEGHGDSTRRENAPRPSGERDATVEVVSFAHGQPGQAAACRIPIRADSTILTTDYCETIARCCVARWVGDLENLKKEAVSRAVGAVNSKIGGRMPGDERVPQGSNPLRTGSRP